MVSDGILSNFLVSNNLGREWNPLLKSLVGGEQLLLVKVCGALVVMILLWNIYRKRSGMAVKGILFSLLNDLFQINDVSYHSDE